jgi:hypothetical protein
VRMTLREETRIDDHLRLGRVPHRRVRALSSVAPPPRGPGFASRGGPDRTMDLLPTLRCCGVGGYRSGVDDHRCWYRCRNSQPRRPSEIAYVLQGDAHSFWIPRRTARITRRSEPRPDAILATTGDVLTGCEEARSGEAGRQLAEQIVTTTHNITSTLDITAVDRDAGQAVVLADTFGQAGGESLSKDQGRLTARDTTIARLTSLRIRFRNSARRSGTARREGLARRAGSVVNSTGLRTNFQQLAAAVPASRLSTIGAASRSRSARTSTRPG